MKIKINNNKINQKMWIMTYNMIYKMKNNKTII